MARQIETEVSSAPGIRAIRSVSRQGRCAVWVDLAPKTGVFQARQRLAERLQHARLPPGVTPMLAPVSFSGREISADRPAFEDQRRHGSSHPGGSCLAQPSFDGARLGARLS